MKAKFDFKTLAKLNKDLESFPQDLMAETSSFTRNIYSNQVYVGVEKPTEDSYSIVAKGFTMPFEEYGAGSMAIAGQVGGVVVGEDTWSIEHKQQYHKWGFWVHNGVKYYYVMPKYAMHKTVTKLKNETGSKAERYFK